MANPIKGVGIVSKPKKTEVREIVPALLEWLRERSIEVAQQPANLGAPHIATLTIRGRNMPPTSR